MRTSPDCAPDAAAQSCRPKHKLELLEQLLPAGEDRGPVVVCMVAAFLVVAAGLVGVGCNGG